MYGHVVNLKPVVDKVMEFFELEPLALGKSIQMSPIKYSRIKKKKIKTNEMK